ncbi:P-type ATPase-like protein [Xylona heveae TC161]|uniref:Cation-transporting ATPase n=1 Tax=Xylona heveae (strain CBS 132557 / TC161) TaxID=1328760 RepID=A0A165GVG5_XYLHT|nr:P-type ATPase-like protein [Xylona heveae TC161]KZF22645.1 P-type ATPase-like protein [Xylona heveae TC161]
MDVENPLIGSDGSPEFYHDGEASVNRHSQIYRRGSNLSETSFVSNVEMAHDEVFAGPMPESVPSSISSFAHRRNRADSTAASFTYLDMNEQQDWDIGGTEIDGDQEYGFEECDVDLEACNLSHPRRKSSTYSGISPEDPLLRRHISTTTDASGVGRGHRVSQKIYILTEDMTIVVAGFSTNVIGSIIYFSLCILSFGLAYLLFKWLPRWKIFLVGSASPLRDCSWVVIENQWGELSLHDISKQSYGRPLSTVFMSQEKSPIGDEEYDEEDPIIDYLRSINYRYVTFFYHPLNGKFVLSNDWKDPSWTDVRSVRAGLDGEERDIRERIFGRNVIEIEEKTLFQLLVDEVLHPFYIFQIASLILWSLDEYYYYAACIFVISVVSIATTLMETKATMRRLHEISRFECDVRVLRNGFWRHVSSGELVPGDVYEVTDPSLTQFPCDSLLLSGDCIVNESMLTGESVPVSKTPATNESLHNLDPGSSSIPSDIAKHFLFSGTKIIRARRPQNDKDDEGVALGLVVRAGFNTTKGALVRSMLFPKPSGFKFYRDSFRYISVMAGVALLGFIASFINFIRLKLAWHLVIVRALDLITIVVPPALPATLTIGTNFALSRLRKKGIFCISPQRVNVGGKLDIVCFDKTGTLTEDGLDVLGVRVVQRPTKRFSDLLSSPSVILPGSFREHDPTLDYDFQKIILYTMATCHSLRSVDKELVGDPLDIKMFGFTGWSFSEGDQKSAVMEEDGQNRLSPSVARPPDGFEPDQMTSGQSLELGILKSFEFVSQLRRASVVVRRFGATGGDIYVKGAPECMKDICRAESFPIDYENLLNYYTHRGFRVIACATKHIPKLNWVKVQKMNRSEAESSLTFVGFIIFENKLKSNTTEILKELGSAGIRRVMCTGDNILTAISVARECSLIDETAHCFVPRFLEGDCTSPNARLVWESVDNPNYRLDEYTLKPQSPPPQSDASLPYDIVNLRNYSVGVSGDVFRWIIDYAPEEIVKRMLVCGEVFARMSPDEKHELVERLQSLEYSCGFCGDGANDCGALTAADVGISLSEAEASVAAPFTSRVFDISCVPEVIREGRAALVTSFSCFKYMSIYSAIQFTSVSFLYASASNLGDFQFLFIDLLLILPIAIFMGWTGAYPTLCRKRPTASLVSRKVLTPLLGQISLCVLIQFIGFEYVRKQPWFVPPQIDHEKSNVRNSENTTLFLTSCYQYTLSAIVLSVGPPFRQSMASNVPLVITLVIATLLSTYMLFDPAKWLFDFMDLTVLSMPFKAFVLALALSGFACSWLAERWVFPHLASAIGKAKTALLPLPPKKRKEYKILKDEMCQS